MKYEKIVLVVQYCLKSGLRAMCAMLWAAQCCGPRNVRGLDCIHLSDRDVNWRTPVQGKSSPAQIKDPYTGSILMQVGANSANTSEIDWSTKKTKIFSKTGRSLRDRETTLRQAKNLVNQRDHSRT